LGFDKPYLTLFLNGTLIESLRFAIRLISFYP